METNPDGEEVTLAVLAAIGEERLRDASPDRSFDRAKQDVGVLVAQTLVDLYGASRVHTLRRRDRKAISARRNTWKELAWVSSYAPHRILPATTPIERIFLDTSVVRHIIHGDSNALDVGRLGECRGDHPVSIADGALAELAAQFGRGSVSPRDWSRRIAGLDRILDRNFPIAPGGRELATLWGAHSPIGFDHGEARAYYRAAWQYLRDVKDAADLSREFIYHAPSGKAYALRLDRAAATNVLAEAGRKWSSWVTKVGTLIRDIRTAGENINEDSLRSLILSNLCLDLGLADGEKLDLVVHVVAKRAIQAAGRTPYNPKGEPNDAMDLDLLFGIPLPGWVCTADENLCKLVRSTNSRDKDKVMSPSELLVRFEGF